jgi:hypothetical protein
MRVGGSSDMDSDENLTHTHHTTQGWLRKLKPARIGSER